MPASRYAEQSICPRICNEALFEDLETGKVFRIVNTHLDHIGAQARILGLRQILEKLKTEKLYPGAATMITGDFNAEPQDPEFEILKEYPEYIASFCASRNLNASSNSSTFAFTSLNSSSVWRSYSVSSPQAGTTPS